MIHHLTRTCCAIMLGLMLGLPAEVWAQKSKNQTAKTTQLSSMDSLSYALGVLFATNLSNEGLSSVDGEALKSGFQATLAGDATMTAAEADAIVRMEMTKLKEQQAQAAKAEGEAFLADNAQKEGINTTSSGCNTSTPRRAPVLRPTPTMK